MPTGVKIAIIGAGSAVQGQPLYPLKQQAAEPDGDGKLFLVLRQVGQSRAPGSQPE